VEAASQHVELDGQDHVLAVGLHVDVALEAAGLRAAERELDDFFLDARRDLPHAALARRGRRAATRHARAR
jgi:hypothetical protein